VMFESVPLGMARTTLIVLNAAILFAGALATDQIELYDSARAETPRCYLVGEEDQRSLLLNNGAAEDMIEVSVFAEGSLTESDFNIVQKSNNDRTLLADDTDTIISPWVSDSVEGGTLYNFTVTFEFDKCPGNLDYTLEVSKKDGTPYCDIDVKYLIAGLCVYNVEPSGNVVYMTGRPGEEAPAWGYEEVYAALDKTFSVYIVFPDGSTSDAPFDKYDFSTMQFSPLAYHQQVAYDFTPGTCDPGAGEYNYQENYVHLANPACQIGFSQNAGPGGQFAGAHIGINFEPYRAGDLGFKIVWDEFTEGSEFEQMFETFFFVRITGDPPPAIYKVDPVGPYSPDGGEEFTVYLYNIDDFQKLEFSVEGNSSPFQVKEGSFKEIGNYTYEVTFITSPGVGTNLPWLLKVTLADGTVLEGVDVTDPSFQFSYYSRPVIYTITPDTGVETGGTIVEVSGAFNSFNKDSDADGVYFDNMKIDPSLIISADENLIVFKTPAKPGQSHQVSLSVVSDGLKSDEATFTYLAASLSVTIVVDGASFSEAQSKYLIGTCAETSYTAVAAASGDVAYTYKWTVANAMGVTLLEATDSVLVVGETALIQGDYSIEVTVTGTTTGASGTAKIEASKTGDFVLGVSISRPVPRTRAVPDAPLRVFADVRLPSCYSASSDLLFEWTYGERSLTMSYENETTADTSTFTPTKLGRECLIAPSELIPGQLTPITVKASVVSDPAVFGQATQMIEILRGKLVAVIGGGEHSTAKDVQGSFQMSCANSYDADLIGDADPSAGLSYEWTCKESTSNDFSDPVDCRQEFLPASDVKEFTVAEGTAEMFVEYTCTVTKDERSASTTQVVEMVGEQLPPFSVKIVDATLTEVDANAVPYYEGLSFVPSLDSDTTITYKVIAPLYQRFTLFSGDNLLPPPTYWQPNDVAAKSLPLGLASMSLEPNTQYEIQCDYSSSALGTEGSAIFKFQTTEKPRLVLLPMAKSQGEPFSYFTVQGLSTIESASFIFRFYLVFDDNTELCVGCDGPSVVSFAISQVGTYKIRAELWDALGKTMIDSRTGDEEIVVALPSTRRQLASVDTAAANGLLTSLFRSGNHNGFQQALYQIARQYQSLESESSEEDRALLKDAIVNMASIVSKSVPSTADGETMAKTCGSLLKLGAQYFEDSAQLYALLQCILEVTQLTPATEKLSVTDTAREALSSSIVVALDQASEGTSRRRLVRQTGQAVNEQLLHVVEVLTRLIADSSARDEYCGFEEYTKSTAGNGLGLSGFDFAVKIVCNTDASQELLVDGDRFAWCQDAIPTDGSRTLFSAISMDDIVLLSHVQGENATDSVKLMMSSIRKFENGLLVDSGAVSTDCYTTSLKMKSNNNPDMTSAAGYMYGNRATSLDTPAVLYESYNRETSAAGVTASVLSESRVATFTSNQPGLFGATYALGATPTSPNDSESSVAGIGVGGIAALTLGLLAFIIIAVLVAWMVATRCLLIAAAPPPPLEPDETYVERDVYGRSVWAEDYGTGDGGADPGMM